MFVFIIKIKILVTAVWLLLQLAIIMTLHTLLSALKEWMLTYIILKYLAKHFLKLYTGFFIRFLKHFTFYVVVYIMFKIKLIRIYLKYLLYFTRMSFIEKLISLNHNILKWQTHWWENFTIINFFIKSSNLNKDNSIQFIFKSLSHFKYLLWLTLLFVLLSYVINYFTNLATPVYICNLMHISCLDFIFLWKIISFTFLIKNVNFLVIHVLQVYMIISITLLFFIY